MADDQTTNNDEISIFDLYKISVTDSIDRSDLWMDIAVQLIRLGVLATSLRAPTELHRHIHAAASICKTQANGEIARSTYYLGVLGNHVAFLDKECARAE